MNAELVIWIVASYLLGAVPFGLVIGFMKGVDIRALGSGNIGATNVFRSVGKAWGILTFALDAAKGFVPAFVFPLLTSSPDSRHSILFGAAAILGHNFPVYLRFKGGKGVATSAGVVLGIAPAAVGIGLGVWAALFVLTRYVSVASIGAALAVMASSWIMYDGTWLLPVALTALGALIIWRHRSNIQRLLNGTENRFGKKQGPNR